MKIILKEKLTIKHGFVQLIQKISHDKTRYFVRRIYISNGHLFKSDDIQKKDLNIIIEEYNTITD
jgi:hypothetical protein